ncbi:MAG: hypothetical protein OES69_16765 [Myxococcales bacterium]|nr:hypothetical protein [Myxococcales bacterium]MDH3845593.1 hypothetical protein [Myxococcales bacterium]
MKKGIFVAIAALALAVFVVPAAQGKHGRSLDLRLSGSNFITSSQPDGTPTPLGQVSTSLQSGIAKGSGSPIFSAQTVIEAPGADPRCGGLPGAGLSTTSVLTYNDGSILSLTTDDEKSFYCFEQTSADPVAGIFIVEFEGTVTGGTGRFEGATGTWVGSAEAQSSRVTADLEIDLD